MWPLARAGIIAAEPPFGEWGKLCEKERDRERLKNYLRRHGLGAWRLNTSQIGITCGDSAATSWEVLFSVECVIAWSESVSWRVG